ncbi:MAG TPA: Ku protein [Byssovorax sp.]|jgi:DNA end-binding protein Ku
MQRRTRRRRAAEPASKGAKSRTFHTAKRKRGGGGDEEPHASRAFWKGSIAFGLVQIPVRVVVAERSDDLTFHQVDRRDHARIRYRRVNEDTGEEVPWAEIAKAYELDSGDMVLLDDEDFERASVEATGTIDIQDFVAVADIPLEFYARSYFLVPERNGKRAYGVLRDAMRKAGRAAVALVVLRTRQHLTAIVPEGDALRLELLHFEHELVPVKTIADELPGKSDVSAREQAVAEQLIDGLAGDWDASKYKDTYKDVLVKAIERKAKTGRIAAPRAKAAAAPKHGDLLALLEKSVARTAKAQPKKRRKAAA